MKSTLLRLLARERGLFAGALMIGVAAIAMGVPVDFVLFALTLAGVAPTCSGPRGCCSTRPASSAGAPGRRQVDSTGSVGVR